MSLFISIYSPALAQARRTPSNGPASKKPPGSYGGPKRGEISSRFGAVPGLEALA